MKPLQLALVLLVFGGFLIGPGVSQHRLEAPVARQELTDTLKRSIQIKAPVDCEVGELVRIDARGSDVDSLAWNVLPATPDFEVVDDGFRAFFSARQGGKYLLIIAGAKDGKAFLHSQHLTVKSAPTPASGLTVKVRDWLKLLPPDVSEDDRKQKLMAMAGVFRNIAEQPINVDEIQKSTALSNSAVLGDSIKSWMPFLDKLGLAVDAMTLETDEHYKTAWIEIADAFERNAK
jgi:hypothetical protein